MSLDAPSAPRRRISQIEGIGMLMTTAMSMKLMTVSASPLVLPQRGSRRSSLDSEVASKRTVSVVSTLIALLNFLNAFARMRTLSSAIFGSSASLATYTVSRFDGSSRPGTSPYFAPTISKSYVANSSISWLTKSILRDERLGIVVYESV